MNAYLLIHGESVAEERRNAKERLMGVAEGKGCRGKHSVNGVADNGCDRKSPLRGVQKVP